eukprot:204217_1
MAQPYKISYVRDEHNNVVVEDGYVFYTDDGFLSCFYVSTFRVDNQKYFCVEQYLMAEKAKLMGDNNVYQQILNVTPDNEGGQKCKGFGRQIKPWDQEKWDAHKEKIYYAGNWHKYTQNKQLKQKLLSYDPEKVFVKTDENDKIWAIGLDIDDKKVCKSENWTGTNLSGKGVTKVRDDILKQDAKCQAKRNVLYGILVATAVCGIGGALYYVYNKKKNQNQTNK